jgi:nitroreductase
MNVAEAIRTKRAVRRFTDQPLPDTAVHTILEAGRRAQSSKNAQPWRFVVIRDRATLTQLAQCGTYAGHLASAALGVALVAMPGYEFDVGQAAAYMQLAAWELGIGSCIATIYDPDKAKAILGVPTELQLNRALSFGYPAPQPAPTAKKKLDRLPLEELVHWEHW